MLPHDHQPVARTTLADRVEKPDNAGATSVHAPKSPRVRRRAGRDAETLRRLDSVSPPASSVIDRGQEVGELEDDGLDHDFDASIAAAIAQASAAHRSTAWQHTGHALRLSLYQRALISTAEAAANDPAIAPENRPQSLAFSLNFSHATLAALKVDPESLLHRAAAQGGELARLSARVEQSRKLAAVASNDKAQARHTRRAVRLLGAMCGAQDDHVAGAMVRSMQQRLSKALRDYGIEPAFYFLLDFTDDARRPHLHGGVLMSSAQRDGLRRALLRVGGEPSLAGFVKRQVRLRPADAGWADTYLAPKLRHITHPQARARIACTQTIRRKAQDLYRTSTARR